METAPSLGWVWQKYETDVIAFVSEWYILSYSAKWLNGLHITKGLPNYQGYKPHQPNDEKLVKDIWKLLNEAEIIIGHNLDRFDLRKAQARFAFWGLPPPKPYLTIDTLKIARKHFAFNSNKLDDLGEYLRLGRKVKHQGFELWEKCMAGDRHAWKKMLSYNRMDVILLERVFNYFKPWINSPKRLLKLLGD